MKVLILWLLWENSCWSLWSGICDLQLRKPRPRGFTGSGQCWDLTWGSRNCYHFIEVQALEKQKRFRGVSVPPGELVSHRRLAEQGLRIRNKYIEWLYFPQHCAILSKSDDLLIFLVSRDITDHLGNKSSAIWWTVASQFKNRPYFKMSVMFIMLLKDIQT